RLALQTGVQAWVDSHPGQATYSRCQQTVRSRALDRLPQRRSLVRSHFPSDERLATLFSPFPHTIPLVVPFCTCGGRTMIRRCLGACLLTAVLGYLPATGQQPPKGFEPLFNGKNLTGWKVS